MLALERADKGAVTNKKMDRKVNKKDQIRELELQLSIAEQSKSPSDSNLSGAFDTRGAKGDNLSRDDLIDLEAGFGSKQKNI